MLVALAFPFRWPGFGWSADQADWAARSIAGLRPWPELDRVVIPDDVEAVWWVAYLSSPAWWVVIIAVIGVFILAAIALRIVWTVVPEEFRPPMEMIGNLIPILVTMALVSTMAAVLPPLLKEIVPSVKEAVSKRLPGG